MKRFSLRKIAGKLHLWLGLTAGTIVLIISLTGCLYVFQEEISSLMYKDILYIEETPTVPALPLYKLWEKAQAKFGSGQKILRAYISKETGKTWSFLVYKYDPSALTYFGNFVYYKSLHINPYTGDITGIIDYKYDVFNIVKYIHWSLLLNNEIGQPIIGWSTIIFVVMTITGIILWWPRNRNAVKQRFKFDLKGHWKKKNYNLHNVTGFYILLIVLIIAFTGLVYAFTWFDDVVYFIATGRTEKPQHTQVKSTPAEVQSPDPLQKALHTSQKTFPGWESIYTTGMPVDSAGTIYMNINMIKGTYYKANELYFNRFTGDLLKGDYYKDYTNGEKFIRMNYDIHVGAIGGLPTKILAFIASLAAASLPITGFMIWMGRKKKRM